MCVCLFIWCSLAQLHSTCPWADHNATHTHAHTQILKCLSFKMSQLTRFKKRESASERGLVPVMDIWMQKLLCHSVARRHQLGVLTRIWEKCCMRHLIRSTAVWLLVICLKATWAANTHRTYVAVVSLVISLVCCEARQKLPLLSLVV